MKLNKSLFVTALILSTVVTTQSYAYKYTVSNRSGTDKQVIIYTALGPSVNFGRLRAGETKTLDSRSIACLAKIEIDGKDHVVLGCGDHQFNILGKQSEVAGKAVQVIKK